MWPPARIAVMPATPLAAPAKVPAPSRKTSAISLTWIGSPPVLSARTSHPSCLSAVVNSRTTDTLTSGPGPATGGPNEYPLRLTCALDGVASTSKRARKGDTSLGLRREIIPGTTVWARTRPCESMSRTSIMRSRISPAPSFRARPATTQRVVSAPANNRISGNATAGSGVWGPRVVAGSAEGFGTEGLGLPPGPEHPIRMSRTRDPTIAKRTMRVPLGRPVGFLCDWRDG